MKFYSDEVTEDVLTLKDSLCDRHLEVGFNRYCAVSRGLCYSSSLAEILVSGRRFFFGFNIHIIHVTDTTNNEKEMLQELINYQPYLSGGCEACPHRRISSPQVDCKVIRKSRGQPTLDNCIGIRLKPFEKVKIGEPQASPANSVAMIVY